MIHFLSGLVDTVAWVLKVLLLLYMAITWLYPKANKWTELLRKVMEPALYPIRVILNQKLPANWQQFDLSPVVALLLVTLIAWIL